MSSRRLPGKVLKPLAGKPLLLHLVDRVRDAGAVTVCTSDHPSDDPVATLCSEARLTCFRGPLDDVAGRMLAAAEDAGAGTFVRLSGDSPLFDPELISQALSLLETEGADLATNIWPIRSFPKGQSVEAIRTDAMARACAAMTDAADQEHVTPYFYRNADAFRIAGFEAGGDFADIQLSVDTTEDFARAEAILAQMDAPAAACGWREVLALNASVETAA